MVGWVMPGDSAVECVTYGDFAAKLSGQMQHSGKVDSGYPEGTARSPS